MSKDLNKCCFIGRLGKDPETRYSPSGTAFTSFTIACGDDYTDKQSNQKVEQTDWVPVVAAGRQAEICGEYLRKGSQVYIEGKFKTRKWQDQSGQDRYTTEVKLTQMQMLGGKQDGQGQQGSYGQQQGGYQAPQQNYQQPQQQAPQNYQQPPKQPKQNPPQNNPPPQQPPVGGMDSFDDDVPW